jgi:hypothetical protein
VALTAWTVVIWVTYQPLLNRRQSDGASDNSKAIISLLGRLLFAFFLCAMVLFFEKFSIQFIAGKFHERSYAGMDVLRIDVKGPQNGSDCDEQRGLPTRKLRSRSWSHCTNTPATYPVARTPSEIRDLAASAQVLVPHDFSRGRSKASGMRRLPQLPPSGMSHRKLQEGASP